MKFLSFILLLAVSVAGYAADLSVRSFRADAFDLSARASERLDRNQNPCALVKVELPLQGCAFEGNVIDAQFKVNSYWVYLTGGTKRMDIRCPGFRTLSVVFANVSDIGELTQSVTYVLDIAGYESAQGGSAVDADPGANFLVFSIEPSDAPAVSLKIDGVPQPVSNGQATSLFDYGDHTYLVEAAGYEPVGGTATVGRDDKTVVNVKLQSSMARLEVRPATEGATVSLNSQKRGTGTWSGELAPGKYLVEVSKDGYRPYSEMITLDKRDDRVLDVPGLSPIVGSLSINYMPVGSKITVDGRDAGTTPAMLRDVLVGSHSVTVSHDGYSSATATVDVAEGTVATLDGSLSKAETNLTSVLKAAKQKYDFVIPFTEGLAHVCLNGKWGYIDETGKEVIPLKYDGARNFSEGLAAVKLNGRWGYIDKTGREVSPLKYDDAGRFSEGLAAVEFNGKWGYIDKTGREVIPLKYDQAYRFSEGLASVQRNGKYGYIDKTGREVIPPKYYFARTFSEGLVAVKLNDKYGYIDKTGREVISFKYDSAYDFSEGLAAVYLNGKYGYIDKTGREVIPLKYDFVRTFTEGLASVQRNGKYGYIDNTGREVIPFKYDFARYFSEGLAAVYLNGKYGYIDKTGKEVIPFKYDDAEPFYNGRARVKLNGNWGYIDKAGNFTPDN